MPIAAALFSLKMFGGEKERKVYIKKKERKKKSTMLQMVKLISAGKTAKLQCPTKSYIVTILANQLSLKFNGNFLLQMNFDFLCIAIIY